MAATHLVFANPPVATPGAVHLVFGDDNTAPSIPDVTLAGSGAVTGLRLRIGVRSGVTLGGAGSITGLRLRIAVAYDINVSRPTVGGAHAHWQDAEPLQQGTRSRWQQSKPLPMGTRDQWQDADRIAAALLGLWHDTDRRQRAARARFEEALRRPAAPIRSAFQEAMGLRIGAQDGFQQASRLPPAPVRAQFQETYRNRQARVGAQFQVAAELPVAIKSGMDIAVRRQHAWGVRFQEAWTPRPGQWQRPSPPRPEPCYTPELPARLVFAGDYAAGLPARLVFVCTRSSNPQPGATVVVPIRSVYVTVNSCVLVRLDNGHIIPATDMAISLDADSWTWSFSASVPGSALADVLPNVNGDPLIAQAAINGTLFNFALERVSRDRVFNSSQIKVSGRGLGVELDAPYAPQMTFGNTSARTARQLLDDILTFNGVSIGWGVGLWQPTDWLVPAGVFNHSGTYVAALNAVVGAAGAYLQPHDTDRTLDVHLRYPTPAWLWSSVTPDFELPAAVTSQEGFEWVDKPVYNRVFVTGQEHGINGQYTRTGTAGDLVAPSIIDPLITHADAARQRGRAVISDTGRIAMVTLRLPVLDETGIIKPGKFVRYTEGGNTHIGITRGLSVAANLPTIYQTLTVETHVEPI